MNPETIKKRIPNITKEEEQWLDEVTEKADKLDQLYNKEYRLICAKTYDTLHKHSKKLRELTKPKPRNTNPCGPNCPSYMDIDCPRNPDSFIPCHLPHRNLSDLHHKQN